MQDCINEEAKKIFPILGMMCFEAKDYENAAKCFQEGLTLDPTNPSLHTSLGNVYHSQGNEKEAIKHYFEALSSLPGSIEILYSIGRSHIDMSNVEEGHRYLEFALERMKLLNTEYHPLQGSILMMLGNFEDAIDHFQCMKNQNIVLSSSDLLNFGTAYFHLERYDEAINVYEEIESDDECKKQALVNIAKCMIHKGENDRASQICDELEQMYADDETIATICKQLRNKVFDVF